VHLCSNRKIPVALVEALVLMEELASIVGLLSIRALMKGSCRHSEAHSKPLRFDRPFDNNNIYLVRSMVHGITLFTCYYWLFATSAVYVIPLHQSPYLLRFCAGKSY